MPTTYIPVQKGFLYLVAVMDWAARRVLSWRLSNTLNTDQGSQFNSQEFTSVLNETGVAISMDGRGRCMDNIFIEPLFRGLKGFRRIFSRLEKLDVVFLGFIVFALIVDGLR